ncbi:MAG TPA: glyoxalase superfamily protein [Candidatus Acidoferrales bacterium]|nr:glyoxalase superfamily protein [Candidatus Acidoferrales bacterium]
MPSFKKIMPVLRVQEMSEAIDWYTRLLGFDLCWRSPGDGDGENCMLQAGEISLMLSTGSHLGAKPAFSGTLYVEMDGVREFFTQIMDEVEIVWPLESMDYGTIEFGIRDRDGYTLAFAEHAPQT